ncbi:MAG: DUF3800 domain-containing protein [Nitrosopumilaceae archaeon]
MYYLYIDESGDPGDYRDENGKIILRSSRYFTLAGIIVNDEVQSQFHEQYERIKSVYFGRFTLPANFKLHFNSLRMQNKFPYDKLTEDERLSLEDDVLTTILSLDCKLLSVTLDLDYHCQKYSNPVWPTALALLYILERFQYFIDEQNSSGVSIFERFTNSMRDKVKREWKILNSYPSFPKPTKWPDLEKVENGDPVKQPILAFADFFGYLPFIRKTSIANWEKFIPQYYRFSERFMSGNVEVEE